MSDRNSMKLAQRRDDASEVMSDLMAWIMKSVIRAHVPESARVHGLTPKMRKAAAKWEHDYVEFVEVVLELFADFATRVKPDAYNEARDRGDMPPCCPPCDMRFAVITTFIVAGASMSDVCDDDEGEFLNTSWMCELAVALLALASPGGPAEDANKKFRAAVRKHDAAYAKAASRDDEGTIDTAAVADLLSELLKGHKR